MKKAIYIIGGGPLGLHVIKTANQLGLATIVTDKNDEAPGLKLATESLLIDASNSNLHVALARSLANQYNIIGVYCGNEIGIWSVYHVSNSLGIKHNSYDSIKTVLDKTLMKRAWGTKIATPQSTVIKSVFELIAYIIQFGGKVIIKPSKGSGSRGVQIVTSNSDLKKAMKICKEVGGDVLVEPYLEGRSIDANGILIDGKLYGAGVLEKYISNPPTCLPLGGHIPVDLPEGEEQEVYDLLERGCKLLGLTFGPVKADLIRTDGGYQLLEVATRFHGDVTTSNILQHIKIHPFEFLYNYLIHDKVYEEFLEPSGNNVAIWRTICLPPGRIIELNAPDPEDNRITKVWINPKNVNEIVPYDNTAKLPGYICAYGNSIKEAERLIKRYFMRFKIEMIINTTHTEWYEALGNRLDELGISKDSCCYIGGKK